MAETANDPPRHHGFRREEAARVRNSWRTVEAVVCPRCDIVLDPSPVPPRDDVSYVRDRVILVCRSCGGSTAVERRDRKAPPPPALPVVGWREWVSLADHAGPRLKAKVDTGARTSALHVEDMQSFDREGQPWLGFLVLPKQRSRSSAFRVEAPLVDERSVRSSSGRAEERPVVMLRITLGATVFPAEVTLTRRDRMGFRMLLGRTALRDRFLVDSATSYLHPLPSRAGEPSRPKTPPSPPSSRK
ncbi:hypothetical protein BH23GEM11_BH23GEM11_13330 [soil metagenome]